MAKIQFAIVSAALVLAVSAVDLSQVVQAIDFSDENTVRYYMACARGFSDGYGKGLWANESEGTSKECLGESTYKHIAELNKYMKSGNFIEIFKSIGKFYQVSFDIQKNCRFNEISFEVTGFCLNKTHDCRPNTLTANLQANFFKVTAAMNTIAEVMFKEYANFGNEDITKVDEATRTYTDFGKSLGDVSRTVLNFTETRSKGGRKKKPVAPKTLSEMFPEDFEE